jgi:tetratricopeptide (TPR) repeat protein
MLERPADAEKVFTELQGSANPEMAAAAGQALKKLKDDQARAARMKAESQVFELARAAKHSEVVAAVNQLEQLGEISFPLQMQRLYALGALKRYPEALALAEKLAASNPAAADLSLVRADLLVQLGRRPEAESIWRRLADQYPGTAAALEAMRRLQEQTLPPPEDQVFELARRQQHREAVAAIDEMERSSPLSFSMEMQRIYSLDALGDEQGALDKAAALAARRPDAPELALLRADLLIRRREWQPAARLLKQLKKEQPDTPAAQAAGERLRALPPVANLDKWYWGEAYASGDYLGRYGALVGSGFIRHGTFVPEVRWLQPYGEFRFGADTRSGVAGGGSGTNGSARRAATIVADNHVGLYGGARAQLLPTEYLFLYGQGGVNKDLLDRREDGDWAGDYQVGVYGFKSWGPGVVFHPEAPAAGPELARPADVAAGQAGETRAPRDSWLWRGHWFVDAGANFSYYHRYRSWIGYGQAHEGFRLAQFGAKLAFDAYLVENLTWDVRGNYFDNFLDFGPGARVIWQPHPHWRVILNADWLQGYYFGRDDRGTRNGASGQYDGVHVALSVGATW